MFAYNKTSVAQRLELPLKELKTLRKMEKGGGGGGGGNFSSSYSTMVWKSFLLQSHFN